MDLNKLTVRYLEKIAEECNITLKKSSKKAEKIKNILSADISDVKLENLYNKYLLEYKSSKNRMKRKPSDKVSSIKVNQLEERIKELEERVKNLISTMSKSSLKINKQNLNSLSELLITNDNPKSIIKSILKPGDSISIDYLIKIKELQKFPIKAIELAVKELIYEESFNAYEGHSIQKLNGNISILTRVS